MINAFIEAAVWHGSLTEADAILAANPAIATATIYTAAILGDDANVRRFLELDPTSATAKGGPRGWDALTHLCFSKYLRLHPERSAAFLRAAKSLIAAGANAQTGFYEGDEFESALYGAAGVAHHAELTRLLVNSGADPNDDEVPYHSPENYDNAALEVLVESGKLTADSLTTMLVRKADWHDLDGIRYLLRNGADPNRSTRWNYTALQQALRRDNSLAIIQLMLDHGANPNQAAPLAARRGRRDVLQLFAQRGITIELEGIDRQIAACAMGDHVASSPELLAIGGTLLAEFASNGSTEGIRRLLDLGVDVNATYPQGDNYFDITKDSTALHVAAWRGSHSTVRLLIDRGAQIDALDAQGRTPLVLAIKACVDSYWSHRRSPESVKALLDAGASPAHVKFPSGYDEVDRLLRP